MNLTIRKIQESDIAPLAEIESRSFSMPWSAEDFAQLLDLPYARYLVALDGDVVLGSAGMRVIANEGNIDNVVVDEKYRGRGVAQALIQSLLQLGDAEGVEAYTLEVRVSNAPAIHVYEKAGFVYEGTRPHFYSNPEEDAAIYWKR